MKVTVTHRSTLRLGGIEPLLDLEESEIEGDEFIDTNESLVRAGHHLALISTRPVMPLERMASLRIDRFFSLPRQNYQFLIWLVGQGVWSDRFQTVRQLPDCYYCVQKVAAPYRITTSRGPRFACPEHLVDHHCPIERVYFEKE